MPQEELESNEKVLLEQLTRHDEINIHLARKIDESSKIIHTYRNIRNLIQALGSSSIARCDKYSGY